MRNRSRSDPRLRNLPDVKITAEEATNMAGVGLFHIKLIIISGLVWMALGFESVVMRFVTSLLSCSWRLELWQGAILDAVTLFSTILGCILYGIWSDKYGRKTAFYSVLFLFILDAVSAASPNFIWFVIFRVVAAFSVGGLYQTLVLCLESFPGNKRGQVVYTLATFWVLGVVIMQHVLFSTAMSGHGWKLFVAIGTLPALLATFLMRFYPESFRYRMVKGKYTDANNIMGEMLKGSGKKMTAQLLELPQMRPRKPIRDLFMLPFKRDSFLLLTLGLLTSICYRGLVDWPGIGSDLYPQNCWKHGTIVQHGSFEVPSNLYTYSNMSKLIDCIKLKDIENFKFITWTTTLDFPAFVIYLILADLINRKILLTASYVLSSICCFLIFVIYFLALPNVLFKSGTVGLCTSLFIISTYCTRTLLLGQHDLILLMVAETFPTSHRGTAIGLEAAIFYLGQFLSYFILMLFLLLSPPILFGVYGGVMIFGSYLCWKGVEETRGKEMKVFINNCMKQDRLSVHVMIEEVPERHRQYQLRKLSYSLSKNNEVSEHEDTIEKPPDESVEEN